MCLSLSLFFTIFSFNMAESQYQFPHQYYYNHQQQPKTTQIAKVATAVTTGGSLLILSGLILATTIIGLTIVTPLFVIFSPVLVPAVIAVALLSLGFTTSGAFGVAAITMLTWLYRYVTGKHPVGADQLETAREKVLNKAREIKDYGQQQISGGGTYSS